MKIVAIGDIHGRDTWKEIVKANPDADMFVFEGDYFDSFDISNAIQMYNFKEIVGFKLDHPNKVILLLGNHDYHYLRGTKNYTGHQSVYQWDIQEILEPLVKDGTIQLAWSYDNYLFTHAGVSNTWCLNWNINTNNIVEELNFMLLRYRDSFGFQGKDAYGDNTTQGPIWIRPNSLTKDAIPNWIHIVGHTRSDKIQYYPFTVGYNTVTIDCLGQGRYLIIENGQLIEKQILQQLPLIETYGYNLTDVIITGDKIYISEWYNVIDNRDKYFLYEIDRRYLKPYLEKRLSHLDLIRQGKFFYMFDLDESYDKNGIFNLDFILNKKPIRFKQLPHDSLPLVDVFIEESICNSATLIKLNKFV